MLFWYTPQILRFHSETASVLGELCNIATGQSECLAELSKEVEILRRERESQAVTYRSAEPPMRSASSGSFGFALTNAFRGPQTDTSEKLRVWLQAIARHSANADLSGPWLDIGCGRGEWLTLLSNNGRKTIGVDTNSSAVAHCRAAGLNVIEADVFAYLCSLEDRSLSVITGFHFAEHLPAECLTTFIALAARKLRPKGLLILETPDPSNLQMAAHYFWNDPTHHRPIPRPLMEYLFRRFGFNVAEVQLLNPFPPEEQLPLAELEPISQLNRLLYGPRDYGIVGRLDA